MVQKIWPPTDVEFHVSQLGDMVEEHVSQRNKDVGIFFRYCDVHGSSYTDYNPDKGRLDTS